MSDQPLFRVSLDQLQQLKERTGASLARVIGCMPDDAGEVVGSGTFVDLFGTIYLATAEHVVKTKFAETTDGQPRYDGLAHDTGNDGPIYRVTNPFYSHGKIRDVAVAKLTGEDFVGTRITPVMMEKVPQFTPPLENDLLFLHGYPGKQSRFIRAFGGIVSESFPWICTEEPTKTGWFDPQIHFAIGYPPEGMDERGFMRPMPEAKGMSGSAIWKTNIIPRGKLWSIDNIQMIGIATDYDHENRVIIGTRIEYFWVVLFHAIQRERAHERWIQRGKPEGDDWDDWFAAVKQIQLLQNVSWLTPVWKQLWTPMSPGFFSRSIDNG